MVSSLGVFAAQDGIEILRWPAAYAVHSHWKACLLDIIALEHPADGPDKPVGKLPITQLANGGGVPTENRIARTAGFTVVQKFTAKALSIGVGPGQRISNYQSRARRPIGVEIDFWLRPDHQNSLTGPGAVFEIVGDLNRSRELRKAVRPFCGQAIRNICCWSKPRY